MWSPNEELESPRHPGEDYYSDGKLKPLPPFYRRHVWKIIAGVLAILVLLLLFSTVILLVVLRTPREVIIVKQVPPAASSQPQVVPTQTPTQASVATPTQPPPAPTSTPSVFTVGSTWQGTYYQHNSVGNYQTPLTLHIDNIQGNTFSGTTTESAFNNAITADTGTIVTDINSLGSPDKERLQEVINKYGSAGTLIMYTDPYQLNGNNVQLNAQLYALVGQDGTLHGIEFDPTHDPSNLTPDGDFSLSKMG